ncbi:MAG TPA: NifU family protein [Bdellovibrionales bacterium]|nr:NifU family protein [Bdellovibrionales bacterium]
MTHDSFDPSHLMIRTLPTPNPFAMKFVINAPFKDEGKATYNTGVECAEVPLLHDLFDIEGVKQIHVFQNTLTVTHSGELDNDELSDKASSVIRTRFPVHNPHFGEEPKPLRPHAVHDDPVLRQIEEILDRTIRPGLQADGGDIELLSFKDNELAIVYQGACGGCPSSMMGTLDAIQGILRYELGNDQLIVVPV